MKEEEIGRFDYRTSTGKSRSKILLDLNQAIPIISQLRVKPDARHYPPASSKKYSLPLVAFVPSCIGLPIGFCWLKSCWLKSFVG